MSIAIDEILIQVPHEIAETYRQATVETSPVLVEVRERSGRAVNLFSGTDFTVDESLGLHGICDFLISRSEEQ